MSEDIKYTQRDIDNLKVNPAFKDWIGTLTERLDSVRRQLEVSGKESIQLRDERGIMVNFVAGHDYLQGQINEIRFILALTDIQSADLQYAVEQTE